MIAAVFLPASTSRMAICLFFATVFLGTIVCSNRSHEMVGPSGGVVVVNAMQQGQVRKVLIGEGSHVASGQSILEITVGANTIADQPSQAPVEQAQSQYRASQGEIAAAQAETERTAVEVQRVRPLVEGGSAPQSELDAAVAQYQRAEERLQHAKQSSQTAQNGLIYQEGKSTNAPVEASPSQVVEVKASADGTLSVLSVKPGDFVTAGQPLATIRTSR